MYNYLMKDRGFDKLVRQNHDNYLEQRAKELNPYGEQPIGPTKEALEQESRNMFPSYKYFPEKARQLAERDLDKLSQVITSLQGLAETTNQNIIAEINKNFKFANPVIFFQTSHRENFQKAWVDESHLLSAELPWYTREHLLLIGAINEKLQGLADTVERTGDRFGMGKNTIAEIKRLTGEPRADIVRNISQTNEAVRQLDFTDNLIFHGLSTNALLDVLDSGSLQCRGKQIVQRGKARFNTTKAKNEKQELNNISFSNNPDRSYTGEWDPNANPYFNVVTPEDFWIVTDLAWLVKNGQRFFYSDGWQMMGKEGGEGFSLSFENDPVVIMATEKSINKIQARIARDLRFKGKDTQQWLKAHTMIIPETIFPQDKWDFRLGNEEQVKIKDIMRQLNPNTILSKQKGFITPSGEFFDDQAGNKVMSYCWTEI